MTCDARLLRAHAESGRPWTCYELDSLRAETMRLLLDDTGRREIWKYDVSPARRVLAEAVDRQNYDDIVTGCDAAKAGKPFALIGAGICDHYFSTPEELIQLVRWLCTPGGYLGCHYAGGC